MQMHDRVAELAGLRAELATCTDGPRESRRSVADAVRKQIDRVRAELAEDAERLEAESRDLADQGQDGRAGDAAVAARVLRTALDADEQEGRTDPQNLNERVALAESRGRAVVAANELRQRDEQRRLAGQLGTEDETKQAARRAAPGKRNAAAPKAPEER